MRRIVFTADAVRQFKRLPKSARSLLKEAIELHLLVGDPTESTRNKFRLKRPAKVADYELRADEFRVFYRIEGHEEVVVTLLGEKRGNKLIVEPEELIL